MGGPMNWARQKWWTAERFGATPRGARNRIRNRTEARILAVTVPKSGTHLLERVLCLHPRLYRPMIPTLHEDNLQDHGGLRTLLPCLRPGQVLFAHLPHQAQFEDAATDAGVRKLLLVRDPRDVAISEVHYTLARSDVPGHVALAREPDLVQRLRVVIEGGEGLAPLGERIERFLGWIDTGAHLVRFEDLVGPEGGGDAERQESTLRGLYEHLGLDLTDRAMVRLRSRVFSAASPTFRRGRVGAWRNEFTPELTALFGREAGPLLTALGYDDSPKRRDP